MSVVCIVAGSSAQISLALDSKCILGESPVWDAKLKRLHFVDINGKKLHSYDPASEKCSTVQVRATLPLRALPCRKSHSTHTAHWGRAGTLLPETKHSSQLRPLLCAV
jgi:sugar lactone lactonase YvrE